jgi:opacity protein-like surface antigen
MKIIGTVVLVTFVLLGAAAAQSEYRGFELFAGYSHVNSNVGLNGWNITGTYRPEVAGWLGVTGDISGAYGSDLVLGRKLNNDMYAGMAGPRVHINVNNDNLQPFGEFLVGFGRNTTWFAGLSDSDTAWVWSLGGGIDYALSDRWSARAKAGLLRTHFFGDADNKPRISLGLAYRFGGEY